MSKTIIYILRHGEVENPQKVLYGRLPGFVLSENGKLKIEEVAKKLRGKGIKYIYTSPMLRARHTADIVSKILRIRPKVSRLINEIRLIFQGVALHIYRSKIQTTLYRKENIEKGQESIKEIGKRMLKFIDIIKKRHQGESILVVSHGDPILILKAATQGIPFTWKYKIENYLQTGEFLTLFCENEHYVWK